MNIYLLGWVLLRTEMGLARAVRPTAQKISISIYESRFETWLYRRSTSAKKMCDVRSLLNVSPRVAAVRPASLLLEASRFALDG